MAPGPSGPGPGGGPAATQLARTGTRPGGPSGPRPGSRAAAFARKRPGGTLPGAGPALRRGPADPSGGHRLLVGGWSGQPGGTPQVPLGYPAGKPLRARPPNPPTRARHLSPPPAPRGHPGGLGGNPRPQPPHRRPALLPGPLPVGKPGLCGRSGRGPGRAGNERPSRLHLLAQSHGDGLSRGAQLLRRARGCAHLHPGLRAGGGSGGRHHPTGAGGGGLRPAWGAGPTSPDSGNAQGSLGGEPKGAQPPRRPPWGWPCRSSTAG